jgi:hypothetical protein
VTDSMPPGHDIPEDTITVSRGVNRQRLLMGVGLVGLMIAALVGVMTLRSNTSASAGGDSPEDAVSSALEALSDEDIIGAAEMLLPTERRSLVEPMLQIVDELKRLEVLDPALGMSDLAGVDLDFTDVQYEVEELTEDLAYVRLVGGQTSAAFDPAALPLGRLVLDYAAPEDLGEATHEITAIEASDDGIAVVRRDGRWYVSLGYSIAEAGRRDADLPLPDPTQALAPRGAISAEGAVESMLRAAVDLDVRRVLELLSPDETEAVHDYASLFLPQAEAEAGRTRKQMKLDEISVELNRVDLSSKAHGRGRLVTIDGLSATVVSPFVNAEMDITGSEGHILITSPEGFDAELRYADGCVTTLFHEPGRPPESEKFCEDDVPGALDEFLGVGELPDFDIFATTPDIGVLTVEVDGDWYVSPLGTLFGAQVDTIAAIDGAKLEALIEWVVDFSESFAV